jgi:acyl-CoA thioesterase II
MSSEHGTTDVDFLGLVADDDPGRFRFTVRNHLSRLDARLYGGTAIAVSLTAAELVSQRAPLWMTTQFVSTAPADAEISVHAEVLAPGRRTNQVRVTATDESGAIMFASLGATGIHRPDGLTGTFEHAPVVTPPGESEPRGGPFATMLRNAGITEMPPLPEGVGFASVVEFREPEVLSHPDPGPSRMCMWVRRRDGVPLTPATAAFIADMVPLSVAHGAGLVAGGISLDNTIRIGAFEPSEWVLVDLRAHFAAGGYGHGAAQLWSESGQLLGTASQTASMFRFDMSNAPWSSGS